MNLLRCVGLRKIIILMIISLLVLTAACTQKRPVKIDEDNGLVINSFYSTVLEMDSREQFDVVMEVENVGGTTANGIEATLSGVNWLNDGITPKLMPLLRPPEKGVPGDFYQVEWPLSAPILKEGITKEFRLIGRAEFEYSSNSITNIQALSKEEFRRRAIKQQTIEQTLDTTNTMGPLKVAISGKTPIIVESEDKFNRYSYRITITNVGEGVPITVDNKDGVLNGDMKVSGPATISECFGQNGGGKTIRFEVTLRQGESATKSCVLTISKGTWGNKFEDVVTMEFSFNYHYYVTKELSIVVHGRESATLPGEGEEPPENGNGKWGLGEISAHECEENENNFKEEIANGVIAQDLKGYEVAEKILMESFDTKNNDVVKKLNVVHSDDATTRIEFSDALKININTIYPRIANVVACHLMCKSANLLKKDENGEIQKYNYIAKSWSICKISGINGNTEGWNTHTSCRPHFPIRGEIIDGIKNINYNDVGGGGIIYVPDVTGHGTEPCNKHAPNIQPQQGVFRATIVDGNMPALVFVGTIIKTDDTTTAQDKYAVIKNNNVYQAYLAVSNGPSEQRIGTGINVRTLNSLSRFDGNYWCACEVSNPD
ncbi:MAG: hypothetical protein J4473_02050 [Candidatus Aenigmarchaeota archaeon]|nr:hypothetical protein [Candidatus Aenigmarchaeota archaeon]